MLDDARAIDLVVILRDGLEVVLALFAASCRSCTNCLRFFFREVGSSSSWLKRRATRRRGLFLKSVESSLLTRYVRQQVREVQILFASLKDSGSELLGVAATVLAERASDLLLMPVVVVAAGSFDRTVCMSSVALNIQDAGHCPACRDDFRTLLDEVVLVSWGL